MLKGKGRREAGAAVMFGGAGVIREEADEVDADVVFSRREVEVAFGAVEFGETDSIWFHL